MWCLNQVLNQKQGERLFESFPVTAVVGTDADNISFFLQNIHISGYGSSGDTCFLCQRGSGFCDIFCVIERYQLHDKTLSLSQFICDIICDIIYVTAEPGRERFGKADGQIDIAVCQLEFRFGKAVLLAEVEDVGDAPAPGFHEAALEEDFTDELVDGFGLWPFVEGLG